MPIEIIESVNGVKYTDGNGFYFRLSQKLNNKLYLNCQVKSCRVRANIPANYSNVPQIIARGQHNHAPDFSEPEFCEVERRVLRRSARETTPLRKILKEETANASPRVLARINYPGFMRRMQRRRHSNVYTLPQSLTDFAERMGSEEYSDFSAVNGQKFFIDAIKNQAIVFLSPTMKDCLKWSDETFTIYETKKIINPNLMKYVMILAKIHQNVAFPIAYIGMAVRTKSIYIDIFKLIQREEPLWNPTSIFATTEPNLNEAILECFPNCKILHSWFHLAQELRKEISNLDLLHALHSDGDFFSCVEILQILPLLPAKYMNAGYEVTKKRALSEKSKEGLSQLYPYIYERWLSGPFASQMSLYNKSERLNIELKLLHRQLMTSFRGNTRREAIWSFTRGIVIMEKKYSEAFREITSEDIVAKWTGSCSVRHQEKKVRSAMTNLDNGKLNIESFLETIVRNGVNIMDLSDDDIQEASEDETYDDYHLAENRDFIDVTTPSIEMMDLDHYIVEEVEEGFCSNSSPDEDEKKFEVIENSRTSTDTSVVSPSKTELERQYEHVKAETESTVFTSTSTPADVLPCTEQLIFSSTNSTSASVKCKVSSYTSVRHSCVLCSKKTYSYACQPCGHLCLCDSCCIGAVMKKCPLCSKDTLWVQEILLPYSL